jgi:RNA polymerase sigma-70 factor, ECF subfamily
MAGAQAPTGEEPAWIREHLPSVLRYAAHFLPLADAEDVAADAALALLQAERAGRAPQVPGAYLLGVARRRIADRRRRQARGLVPGPLPAGWERVCDEPLAPEVLASRELALLVHVALGVLPASETRLLEGRYRAGLSTAALAEREGLTPKAVERRLARARVALREVLAQAAPAWSGTGSDGEASS